MDSADTQLTLPPHVARAMEQTPAYPQNGTGETHTAQPIHGGYEIPGVPASSGATFGVDLGEQLARDGRELPKVIEKCAQAIEAFGELL